MARVASLTFRRDSLNTLARALQAALGEAPVAEAVQAAMRRTAYRVKNRTTGNLDRHFTIRRKPFIVKGLRVKQARRGAKLRDVFSEVGTIDQFMADHDSEAENFRAPKEAKRRWEPLGARPYAQAETPPNQWPKATLRSAQKPKAFAVIREGKPTIIGRRETTKPYPVRWLWKETGERNQPIPDDWPFEAEASAEIDAVLLDRMEWELDKLVRKAGWH